MRKRDWRAKGNVRNKHPTPGRGCRRPTHRGAWTPIHGGMFSTDQYELLDIGGGRRLERFGQYILDRPAPAAAGVSLQRPGLRQQADARFDRDRSTRGVWTRRSPLPRTWHISHDEIVFELKCSDSGAIGVFPEQAANWDWIAGKVRQARRQLKILNLFAYSGGGTLSAAAAGAQVVHVDAARSAINWARRNAQLSGLETAPIRWIVEDARKFAQREVRRGTQYDAVILDPPTYGHGPKSQPWKLIHHLDELLHAVRHLTRDHRTFILLTSHTPGLGPHELRTILAENALENSKDDVLAKPLFLKTRDGQRLPSGVMARWPRH